MPTATLAMLEEPGLARMIADGSAVIHGEKSPRGPAAAKRDRRKTKLLGNYFAAKDATLCFVVGVVTASESNGRVWQQRNVRTHGARLAISRAFGPHLRALATIAEHYHGGHRIEAVMTRLGGGKLDRGVNLPASMKAIEDAVCLMLGADDGDDRWRVRFEQEPLCGDGLGVRIELRGT